MIREHEWLGLCLYTEADREEEWPFIAAVIYRRMQSRRYPSTARGVVLQRAQFSYFNPWTAKGEPPENADMEVWRGVEKARRAKGDPLLLIRACVFAARASVAPDIHLPLEVITPDVLHYYSPVSMRPKGSRPKWAASARRLFTPDGIDPERFVFAAGVP